MIFSYCLFFHAFFFQKNTTYFSKMDHDQREICLIDMGITSMAKLELPEILINLNLHSNAIKEISNVTNLVQMKYLDLSSNHIKKISGINSCVSLQILNLACNELSKVEGIEKLRLVCFRNVLVSFVT